jgi:hypothetical protein
MQQQTSFPDSKLPQGRTTLLVFSFLWVLLFAIYFPAARAGFVADFTGWLDQVKNHSFSEFINRTHFQAKSLYQLTQFNTWFFYKLFGINPWMWHILFITLHTINACLLFKLCAGLLEDVGVNKSKTISFGGAVLFCLSPYISEVVVWEPAFHFLQGLLLILLVLVWAQQYIRTGAAKYAWWALIVYFLSNFSLEIFYITPWLVLAMAIFYNAVQPGKSNFKKVLLSFVLPMVLMSAVRFVTYRVYAGDWVSRIGSSAVSAITMDSFSKPAKHIFDLLFVGRFLPDDFRKNVYELCDGTTGLAGFYGGVLVVLGYVILYFKKMNGTVKAALLLAVWMLIPLLIIVPLTFSADMLVQYDRYIYFSGAFFYMLFSVVASLVTIRYAYLGIIALYALINLRFAIQASRYWGKSERVVSGLLHNIPDDRSKTMILLNLPQNMRGVPMIGAEKNSEYKLMHDLLVPEKQLTNTVYDVLAYNMLAPDNGAHVNVINDSMIKVTLNQYGTWWWFETRGGYSYWTADYKLDLKDPGHWYELTLRKPADQYLLLYSVGDQWKVVDMKKREGDQN